MVNTLYELGLTEDDFTFEFMDFVDLSYPYGGFNPTRILVAKVNGVTCKVKTTINIELMQDLENMHNFDAKEEVNKLLKEEAIRYFINSNQFIRKLKLNKIKEKYGFI